MTSLGIWVTHFVPDEDFHAEDDRRAFMFFYEILFHSYFFDYGIFHPVPADKKDALFEFADMINTLSLSKFLDQIESSGDRYHQHKFLRRIIRIYCRVYNFKLEDILETGRIQYENTKVFEDEEINIRHRWPTIVKMIKDSFARLENRRFFYMQFTPYPDDILLDLNTLPIII